MAIIIPSFAAVLLSYSPLLVGSLLILFAFLSCIIVREGEAVVLERLGKFSQLLTAGVHFALPIINSKKKVTWSSIQRINGRTESSVFSSSFIPYKREIVFDPRPVQCMTKSGASVGVDAAVRLIIDNPVKCVYEVDDLYRSLQILVESVLFKLVQESNLETVINNRGKLGGEVSIELNEQVAKWGIKIVAVDIQNMDIPKQLTESILTYLKKEQENKVILAAEEGRRNLEISKLTSQAAIDLQMHDNNMAKIMQERKESLERAETAAMVKKVEAQSKEETLGILFGDNATNKHEYILDEMKTKALLSSQPESVRTVVIPHDMKLVSDRFVSAY